MGNLVNTIKKFLGNKNTVTIICLLAGVAVIYFFYNYRVNQAITPIRVPIAKAAINAAEEITADNIDYIEVSRNFLNKASVYSGSEVAQLVGKYVTTGTSIPENGLFYKSQVVDKSALNNSIFDNLPNGETPFSLSVNNHSTFGNSIYPGDTIDLFLKATDDNGKLIYGKFIEGITVLAVFDSSGKDAFSFGQTNEPAELIFSVKDELYTLLKDTEFLSGVSLVPVPRNKNYKPNDGEIKTYESLRDFILSKTSSLLDSE